MFKMCSRTYLLVRLSLGVRSQSVLNIMHSQVRCVNLKITKPEPMDSFTHEERNQISGRPLSPYLTVYAPQLTTMMSISHRFTGMLLSGYAILLATASFYTSDMGDVAHTISNWGIPGLIIFIFKLGFCFPAVYHLCNGLRHLLWDFGKNLELKHVYIGGYITLAAAAVLAIYVAW